MLGNFSAIISQRRRYQIRLGVCDWRDDFVKRQTLISVHDSDDEAAKSWEKYIAKDRIVRMATKITWQMLIRIRWTVF